MKYVIVLGDGMADYPLEELGGKTPLEAAETPMMDRLSKVSEVGLCHTIPDGMSPGSDTANLSVIGYDPKKYYSGRSPLEALSIGVDMKPTDVSFRCNLVTVSEEEAVYEEKTILDHSSGEITTEEAAQLIDAIRPALETEEFRFYVGTAYRHLTIWDRGEIVELTPPHDILGKTIGGYLPGQAALREMMKKSYAILAEHPVNLARKARGLNPANSLWFWGAGTRPALTSFEEKTGKKGVMISAVDLLKGIAVGAKMDTIAVEGADGTLNTNYEGKAKAATDALLNGGYDLAYIHVEAPDEMGHQGSIEKKIRSIEYLDGRVIKPVVEAMEAAGAEYRMLVMPDHPTPIALRTHVSDPVPYLLYDSANPVRNPYPYSEQGAKDSGIYVAEGHTMIDHLLERQRAIC